MENKAEKFSRNLGEYNYLLRDGADEFLINFCKHHNPKNVLEIGTAYGYSAFLILSNCYCKITTIELDQNKVEIAKKNIKHENLDERCTFLCGDAKEILPTLNEKYSLIFLDGPKGQYIKYLPILINLLDDGGYLIADNVYFQNRVFQEGKIPHKHRTIVNNLRKFIEEISNNKNLETTLYSIGDGISVSKKIWIWNCWYKIV